MKLTTISGLDGSGKSTQIQMLKEYLESQGKRVFYFHAIEFGLANKISRKINNSGKSVIRANGFQIFLRKIFLHIDICRFNLLRNKLRNKNYDYILSDRYFYDTVVNIEFLCRERIHTFQKILKPDVAIYLQTLPEIIMQRRRVPDQGIEYLKKKKELYDNKISVWNWNVVDGNRNKEEIFEEIKKAVAVDTN